MERQSPFPDYMQINGPDNYWPQADIEASNRGSMRVPGAGSAACHMSIRPEVLALGIGAALKMAATLAGSTGGEAGWCWEECHAALVRAHEMARQALNGGTRPADGDAES